MPHLNDCSYYTMRDTARVSNVQTHLENSKFHLHQNQSQSQQVKQYLTLGSKLAGGQGQGHTAPGHPHAPGQPLGAVPVMRNGHMPSVSDGSPNSPVTMLTLAASHDSEFPMDEVIDDLISLESGFNDGGLDCMESNIMMQNNCRVPSVLVSCPSVLVSCPSVLVSCPSVLVSCPSVLVSCPRKSPQSSRRGVLRFQIQL
ncbi:transcription factor EC [Osmerus mordax]|uniref:transcription factor EC n=1 Tax=Osmerus mordax TaxID=8014 RepID=UPI003510B51C